MDKYIKTIEEIASKNTCSQSDGYSQILRICDAIKAAEKCEPNCSCDICRFSSPHDYVPNHYYCNKGLFFNDREPRSNCEKGEIVGRMYERKYGRPFNK